MTGVRTKESILFGRSTGYCGCSHFISIQVSLKHNFRTANERVTDVCREHLSLSLSFSFSADLHPSPLIRSTWGADSPARELEPLLRNIPGSFASTVIRIDSSRPRSVVVKRKILVEGHRETEELANDRREWSPLWCSVLSQMISVRPIIVIDFSEYLTVIWQREFWRLTRVKVIVPKSDDCI